MSDELPEGWVETTLDQLNDPASPVGYGVLKPGEQTNDGVVMLRVKDVYDGSVHLDEVYRITASLDREFARSRIAPGDLVISVQGSVGRVAIVPDGLVGANISRTLARIRPALGELAPWLWAYLQAPQAQTRMGAVIGGTTRDSLNIRDLRVLEVPLPPPPEQGRIVESVRALLEQVTRAKGRLDRVQLILKRFRQAVLAAACSGRLTEEWREANTSSPSGADALRELLVERRKAATVGRYREPSGAAPLEGIELPASWTWASFDQITTLITKGSSPGWQGFEYVDAGTLFVRSQNVRWGSLDLTERVFLEARFNGEHPSSVIRDGDLLLNLVGASVGRSAIATKEADGANCNQAVGVLRLVNGQILRGWVLQYLLSPFAQGHIGTNKVDVARANFNLDDIKAMPVPLPPFAEQTEIVRQADKLFALADTIEGRLHAATLRAEKLPQAILSKAFSGELVRTEAELARVEGRTYETAEELLARVTSAAKEESKKAGGKRRRRAG